MSVAKFSRIYKNGSVGATPTSNMTEVRNNAEDCFQAEQLGAVAKLKVKTGGESVAGSQYCDGKGNVCQGKKMITFPLRNNLYLNSCTMIKIY